jgi:hypothetical protein
MTVLVAPAASATPAGRVPVQRGPQLTAAGSPASAQPSQGRILHPLRPHDSTQYARQKATADAAYRRWLSAHPSVAGEKPGSPLASIVALKKPGFSATNEGNTSTPPDTTGAIGRTNYLEFVNSEAVVYNRTTLALVSKLSEDSFTGSSSTCDGQIKWDDQAGRWLYWSLDCAAPVGSQGWSIGWSKTSNPLPLAGDNTTSGWCKFHLNSGHNLDDYGKLGQDNGWLEVGANRFQDNNNNPSVPVVWTVSKPAVGVSTCPAPTAVQVFFFLPTAANAFTPEPANILGSSANGYIVATHTSTALRMYRLTGLPPAAPTLFDDGDITVTSYAVPPSLTQPGSSDVVDTSDTRLTQANAALDPGLGSGVFGIWTQHTVAGPGGAGSVVRWYELQDGNAAPVQTGTIAAPGAGSFAFNAAIAPNSTGNAAAIDYNTAKPTTRIGVRARIHAIGAAPGATSNEAIIVSSTGIVDDFSCPSQTGGGRPCRWGDYAGASTDPLGGNAVWGTAELTGAPDTTFFLAEWKTENFKLLVH